MPDAQKMGHFSCFIAVLLTNVSKSLFSQRKRHKKCPVGNTDRKESPYRDNTMA